MKRKLAFLVLPLGFLGLVSFDLPTVSSAATVDYTAVIQVFNASGASLGYVAPDPSYWTPLLNPTTTGALVVDFTLNGTSGSQINLTTQNTWEAPYSYVGLVQGRDSTDATIGPGSFNYLYIDATNPTSPGSTPQNVGNYFSSGSGLQHPSESAVWTIDLNAGLTNGALVPVWVNPNGTTATTETFVQSNHLYAGGDANAFHNRYPAPVTDVTLQLDILTATPVQGSAPEPAAFWTVTLGVLGVGMLRRARRSKSC